MSTGESSSTAATPPPIRRCSRWATPSASAATTCCSREPSIGKPPSTTDSALPRPFWASLRPPTPHPGSGPTATTCTWKPSAPWPPLDTPSSAELSARRRFSAFGLVRDRVVGAVAVGDSGAVRAARRMIDRGISVERDRLADPTTDLRKLLRG
ncbi:oxidoreductase C-terminal domain-containing protein [Nocardia sp. NPDC050713]|uniref:oxidoreductase C-terminal domain-containing protein n=1 Tax=Nocardia sp. NPDC050713 TaxID=3154511 RepID=UPI0033E53C12